MSFNCFLTQIRLITVWNGHSGLRAIEYFLSLLSVVVYAYSFWKFCILYWLPWQLFVEVASITIVVFYY